MAKRLTIKAKRWPWQIRESVAMLSGPDEKRGERYGWKQTRGTGRFGAGWNYSLGIEVSGFYDTGTSIMLNLLFGYISITYRTAKGLKLDQEYEEARVKRA